MSKGKLERDSAWHKEHGKKLKRRKKIAKAHLLALKRPVAKKKKVVAPKANPILAKVSWWKKIIHRIKQILK